MSKMSDDAQKCLEAARLVTELAKHGYDLSESERTTLLRAASVLQSWAQSLPQKA